MTSEGAGKWAGIVQVLQAGPEECYLWQILAPVGIPSWEKPICAVQITGLRPQILSWGRFARAYLCAASNRVAVDHKI